MSIFNPLSLLTGGGIVQTLTVGLVAASVAFGAGYWKGSANASARAEAKAAKAVISQLKERGLINEAVGNLDTVDLCIELGGVPDDCRQ